VAAGELCSRSTCSRSRPERAAPPPRSPASPARLQQQCWPSPRCRPRPPPLLQIGAPPLLVVPLLPPKLPSPMMLSRYSWRSRASSVEPQGLSWWMPCPYDGLEQAAHVIAACQAEPRLAAAAAHDQVDKKRGGNFSILLRKRPCPALPAAVPFILLPAKLPSPKLLLRLWRAVDTGEAPPDTSNCRCCCACCC